MNTVTAEILNQPLLERLRFITELLPADTVALSDDHKQLSYSQLCEQSAELAQWLSEKNCKVVALKADNSVDWVLLDLACQLAKIILLPLPDFFSASQIINCLRKSGADLLFSDSDLPAEISAALKNIQPLNSQAPLINRLKLWSIQADSACNTPTGTEKITFTSGSTGTPKGVCLTSQQQWQVAESIASSIDLNRPKHLCVLPLATLLENIAGVYTPLLSGGHVILACSKSRGLSGSSGLNATVFLQYLHQSEAHSIIILPQLLSVLVAACNNGWQAPASLKFIAVGGARVAPELIKRAHDFHLPVYEGYGLSECGSVVALNTFEHNAPNRVGQALPHCQIQIENGEIVIQGSAHLGYLGEPDSWYPEIIRSGDLGYIDDGGYLSVQGRRKNLLISSFGRNINPEWVESELQAQPLLSHCTVIGDAQPFLVALVSAADLIADQTIETMIAETNSRLPDYAQIKNWQRLKQEFWQDVSTANGRPQREKIMIKFAEIIKQLYRESTHNKFSAVS